MQLLVSAKCYAIRRCRQTDSSITSIWQTWASPGQILARIFRRKNNPDDAMKTNATDKSGFGGQGGAVHPPPVVHPASEPEYDTEQLKRRADQVTDVLEHILHECPLPPLPGRNAPESVPKPPTPPGQ
jgi:hypothetical protein